MGMSTTARVCAVTRNAGARGYAIVHPDDVSDVYAGSDVPGEFRR